MASLMWACKISFFFFFFFFFLVEGYCRSHTDGHLFRLRPLVPRDESDESNVDHVNKYSSVSFILKSV